MLQYLAIALLVGAAIVFLIGVVLAKAYKRWRACVYKESNITASNEETHENLVHRIDSHKDLLQNMEVEQKDSLDGYLDSMAKKLAEKESRLKVSKNRILETQKVVENIPVGADIRSKYQEIMNNLKYDLQSNESECAKLQEQIDWVVEKRAELKDYVRQGQHLYGIAAAELAYNLTELQKGRVTEKPTESYSSLRHRSGPPGFSNPSATGSIVVKSVPGSPKSEAISTFD